MQKEKKRGGVREGAGRPRILNNSCKPRTIYCSLTEKRYMEKFLAFLRITEKQEITPYMADVPLGEFWEFLATGVPTANVMAGLPEDVVMAMEEKIKAIDNKEIQIRKKRKTE